MGLVLGDNRKADGEAPDGNGSGRGTRRIRATTDDDSVVLYVGLHASTAFGQPAVLVWHKRRFGARSSTVAGTGRRLVWTS